MISINDIVHVNEALYPCGYRSMGIANTLTPHEDYTQVSVKDWTEALEVEHGLSRQAIPLWIAGSGQLSLAETLALERWCRSEPSLAKRIAEAKARVKEAKDWRTDIKRRRDAKAKNDQFYGDTKQINRLKVATLLFHEAYVFDAEKRWVRNNLTVAEAARRVHKSGHREVKGYTGWEAIADLHQDKELMRDAKANHFFWENNQT